MDNDSQETIENSNATHVTCKAYVNFKKRETIDLSFYAHQQIGHGTFGKIHKIVLENKPLALKIVHQDPNYCNRELEILELLRSHNNVLNLIYSYYTRYDGKIYLNLITELLGDSLYNKIYKHRRDKNGNNIGTVSRSNTRKISKIDNEAHSENIKPEEMASWTRDLFSGLSFIHSKNVMHRDLKPENLVFSINGDLKIIDLGSAKVLKQGFANSTEVCTLLYRAPELLMGYSGYGPKIDIWSAGCILCETLLSSPLFLESDSNTLLRKIVDFIGPPPLMFSLTLTKTQYKELARTEQVNIHKNLSDKIPKLNNNEYIGLVNVIASTLCYQDRLSASDILSLDYFNN